MLVRRSNTAVVDFWDEILEIIATCGDREKDFELKKMIAELESRMMNRTFEKVQFKDNVQLRG